MTARWHIPISIRAKLKLTDSICTDLFYYTSVDEFDTVRGIIEAAPNFEEVVAAAGTKAYSSGMVLPFFILDFYL